jgi:hypothetical protein
MKHTESVPVFGVADPYWKQEDAPPVVGHGTLGQEGPTRKVVASWVAVQDRVVLVDPGAHVQTSAE